MAHRFARPDCCPIDGFRLDITTDQIGRTVVTCVGCLRRRARKCMDCGQPVAGKSWRCAAHQGAARRRQMRAYDARNHEERLAAGRARWRKSPERRKRKRELRRAWAKRNPERDREHKRRDVERHRIRHLSYHRQYNMRPGRAESKRAHAKARYYELHPVRPDPKCAGCQNKLSWTPGRGRPPKWCDGCRPWPRRKMAVAA